MIVKKKDVNNTFCPSCGGSELQYEFEECKGKKFNLTYVNTQVYGFMGGDNPLKIYINQISKTKAEPLVALEELNDNETLKTAIFIKNIKKYIDKKGNEMAFIDVSDGDYNCSLTIFASDWDKLKEEIKIGVCFILKANKNRGNNLLFNSRGSKKYQSKLIRLGI
jgi:DNA polymerase III alpha subunit